MCGEHGRCVICICLRHGSSPRVRGTRLVVLARVGDVRFIPACAGNTEVAASGFACDAVHPRVCGEHEVLTPEVGRVTGSSPRVRGTLSRLRRCGQRTRFIPACAGNTRARGVCVASTSVHPRVCGEHNTSKYSFHFYSGSSPRVRGTRRLILLRPLRFRFIPACAGNTSPLPIFCCSLPVHPRVCGEHLT